MGSSSSKTAYSANNTRGASVAALNEQLRQLLERLDQEAAKYANSKVNDDESIEWNPSQAEVQLITAAWKCARGTYDLQGTMADTSYCTFRRHQVIESSFAGTVKRITSTVIEAKTGSPTTDSLPVLVLAIRGSASQSARFSCVTFGAPPCLTQHVDLDIFQPSNGTVCVNVINEFDVVTRADKPYILSLVDVARAMLDLPPRTNISELETSEEIVSVALEATRDENRRLSDDSEDVPVKESNLWRFPRALYHHFGPRVVLLTRFIDNQMSLKAVEISTSEFKKLLFCRVAVHGKSLYEERINALEQGRFNNRSA
ncbi:hypothetical protein FGADI_3989 [Fusarium gaditjirri]|uniref:Uncharacterized protein n=1 Tax=Fusarium gaditjirri TaxID=282569 RepID=A0A8H4WZ45_9HYPO|nr:hypothetical protein FGADI_3989 [Fusarium gaditjirri]